MKKLLKQVYHALPLKKQLFSIIKTVWTPPQNIYQHLYFDSAFTVKIDNKHCFKVNSDGSNITNEIFWKGIFDGWEGMSMTIWKKLSARSNVILDIGANGGIYALVSKAMNPNSEVHAFEPSALWHNRLLKNNQINNYDIQCHKLGVSNQDAVISLKGVWDKENNEFPVTRMDTFIEKNNIQQIDLVKIDVELHEPQVIEGFKNYIEKYRPVLIIEILRDEIGMQVESQIDFKKLGYLFFNIDDKEGILRKENLRRSPNKCWNYLVCNKEIAEDLGIKF